MLSNRTVKDFVAELASDSPAPGGGSVAALCGALSAALTAMVGRLTVGKEKYKDSWEAMQAILDQADVMSTSMLDLMEKDTAAFNGYMAAMKMPKETEAEKSARKNAMQTAAIGSTAVPLETMELCLAMGRLAARALGKGNPNALSDAATAVMLAKASATAAQYNVLINLPGIADQAFTADCRKRCAAALAELDAIAERADRSVLAILAR